MNICVVRAEDIICRQIGEETVVIKDNGLSTHVLNKTAAYIWKLCDHAGNIEEIIDKICQRFDVDSKEADADVRATIDQLLETGLLTRSRK
jgi:hypothetical protein